MNKITATGIEHSISDTFIFTVSPMANETFDDNSILNFVVAKQENESPIIDKSYTLNEGQFIITLTDEEKTKLPLGNYIYKMIIISNNGIVSTEKSGFLDVVWGA